MGLRAFCDVKPIQITTPNNVAQQRRKKVPVNPIQEKRIKEKIETRFTVANNAFSREDRRLMMTTKCKG